jgi:predicted RNA binding protein YcfA (HicA-like mRNA interferase family)
MAPQFDRELRKLLTEAGCYLVRQGKGSHEIWFSPITQRTFTVPANIDGRPLANAILKQAGLPKSF